MMVVLVLMTSCQVSENPKMGPVAAQMRMARTASAKAHEEPVHPVALREKASSALPIERCLVIASFRIWSHPPPPMIMSAPRAGRVSVASQPPEGGSALAALRPLWFNVRMARAKGPDGRIKLLLGVLESAYAGPAWHGTTLKGSLRGVTGAEALAGPRGRKNIWQHALHAAYWKYIVSRALDRGTPAFERSPSNWPDPARGLDGSSGPGEREWSEDRAYLDSLHRALVGIVSVFPAERLEEAPQKRKKWRCVDLILGAAQHDLYHTGQVQLLKRLVRGD